MKYTRFLRTVAFAMILTLLLTLPVLSQPTEFNISVDKLDRTLPPGGFTTYEVIVRNTATTDLKIVAERTVNDLPDTSWHSSVCSEFNCYEENVSVLPAENLAAGDSTFFKMHITAGTQLNDTARFALRFYVEGSQAFIEQTVTVITVEPKPSVFTINALQKEMSADAGGEVEFYIGLGNLTGSLLEMRVRRVENNFPNSSWQSRLCMPDSCLMPEVTITPDVVIEPSKAVYIRLKIFAGSPGDGKVTLQFDAGEGVDPAYEQFTVSVATLSVGDPILNTTTAAAYPNPAQTSVTIPLPDVAMNEASASLVLYDERGVVAAELSAQATLALRMGHRSLSVGLSGLSAGTYRYRLSAGEELQQGAIVLVR